MTKGQYQDFVQECNHAISSDSKNFSYEGKDYSVEFKYVLALMAKDYGFSYRFDDQFLTLKPQKK
tara:strand:- start:506 stop:700 length:195 start_codon:yes stop_codon:yes gene_type:complete